ncbi:MAG: hypothetical protein H0V82_07465 [Candidatus Protochlamydia sp.]|nr:hypothetical protein [Candidatus Protochlamydia sp.]
MIRKLDHSEVNFNCENILTIFPKELIDKITLYLDTISLLNFEVLNKSCRYHSGKRWEAKKLETYSNIKFNLTQSEGNPEKWNYFIIKEIYRYIVTDGNSSTTIYPQPDPKKIISDYLFITSRFPILNKYINHDITRLGHPETPIVPDIVKKFNDTVREGSASGELLLQAIILTRGRIHKAEDVKKVRKSFKLAIQKGATCAGILAIKLNLQIGNNSFGQTAFNLAIALKAAEQQDERALHMILLNKNCGVRFAKQFYNEGLRFHSLLIFLANDSLLENDCIKAEQYINDALLLPEEKIISLKDNHYLKALERAANFKKELCKWVHAKNLYERLLLSYGTMIYPTSELLDQINFVNNQIK